MKILYVLLFCLIGFVSFNYFYGENGLKKRNEVIASKKLALKKTEQLNKNKFVLEQTLKDLKKNKNSEIIEDIARSNLGMIKSDEKFYRKVDN
jgi:cell division protein FtsB